MKNAAKNEAATGATATASEPKNLADQAQLQEPNNSDSAGGEIKPEEPLVGAVESTTPLTPDNQDAGEQTATEALPTAQLQPRFGKDVVFRKTSDLKPHPRNAEIYGENVNPELIENIEAHGILQPLLISKYGIIIAGHQRHAAAVALGIPEVPVVIFDSTDELEILGALIGSNKTRPKDNVLLALEAKELMEVESKLAKQRMATKKAGEGVKIVSQAEAGPAREKVGEHLGVSGPTAQALAETATAIESLEEEGRQVEADEVKKKLKKSVSAGHNAAKETGAVPPKPRKPSAAPRKKGSTSKVLFGPRN